jgi:ABC-type multidrug transport system fused ATPase/permease subunit
MNQLKQILRFAKPYGKTILFIIFLIFILAGLNQVEPFINRGLIDAVAPLIQLKKFTLPQQIIPLFVLLLVIRFTRAIIRRAQNYFTAIFTYQFRFALREKGFSHLMGLSVNFFDQTISGELMSKLDRGTAQITNIVNNSGQTFIPNLLTAIIGIGVVFKFYPPLALWMVLMFVPFTIISLWRFNKNKDLEKMEYRLYDNQYGHFWEVVTSIRLIKSFIAENFEIKQLKNFHQHILLLRKQVERNWNLSTIGDLFLELWNWSIYVWVIIMGLQGKFSIGTIILLINYTDIVRWPLWELNWFFWEAKSAQIGSRDYFKILNIESEIKDPLRPTDLPIIKGKITFNHLSFTYPQLPNQKFLGQPGGVLKNINLTIEPGTTVAFIGPSGSGKTTIVSLISRFYDPNQGSVLIDGVDVRKIKQRLLRNHIGWVTQEPYLFADTIEENLRYGNPKATQQELEAAAKIAYAHNFISKLPQGYQSKIGERGIQLSGGQKQRLALARVILKNPPILILDEATSALDSVSEAYIQKALEKIIKNRTAIIIAHRLSTARKASKIFVLDRGEIIEQGNHQELMQQNGLYASLFKIQAGKTEKLTKWDLVA